MRLLIIGAKGFIGSHCVNYFRLHDHIVYCCDLLESDDTDYVSYSALNGDFNKLFNNQKFDACINAAGSANVSYSFMFPEKDFQMNVSLVIDVMAAIKTNCPECKFVNFSSAAVYGNPTQLPIKENAELKPLSPYGYHKMLSEKLLTEYHRFFKLQTCSLRVFSTYGPGLRKQLFWDLYQKSKVGNDISLFGTGKESRDFIYIDDLVKALDIILQKAPFKGECINVSSGIETHISEAVGVFLDHFTPSKRVVFDGIQKQGDPLNWLSDINYLQKLGFEPEVKLKVGLSSVAEWLKKENA